MKLIHCSDLHLDSPMGTNLGTAKAKERNGEICRTFGQMVEYACAQKVKAILIAGDLFDGSRVTDRTADYVLDTISLADQITFFYIKGNHDESSKAFAGRELPPNLVTFGPEWKTCSLQENGEAEVRITAIEPADWTGDFYDRLRLQGDVINIVMLHGQTGLTPGPETVCLPKLRRKQIAYLALGHYHRYEQEALEPGVNYCYCGCLEGRGFDECGDKGFVLLETDSFGIHSRFVPFARRRLHELDVDITELTTITQLRQALLAAATELPPTDLVRFTLRGTYTLDTQKDLHFLEESLRDYFYHVAVKDESRLLLGEADYRYDISLKGAFLRSVMGSELSEEDRDQVIAYGIAALKGEEFL